MFELPTEVRSSFVDFAADVVEQHESQMTAIDFEALVSKNEVSASDQRLAEVL